MFSRGIWKSVYLVQINWASIVDVTPVTKYMGDFPTVPLIDGRHGGFTLNTTVRVYSMSKVAAVATDFGLLVEYGDSWRAGHFDARIQHFHDSHDSSRF